MEAFEMMSPLVHFYVYFVLGIMAVLILRTIFKNSPTYYIIFLSTILLFSWFSKDLFVYLPYNALEIKSILAKMAGSTIGVVIMHLYFWSKKRKKIRRLL